MVTHHPGLPCSLPSCFLLPAEGTGPPLCPGPSVPTRSGSLPQPLRRDQQSAKVPSHPNHPGIWTFPELGSSRLISRCCRVGNEGARRAGEGGSAALQVLGAMCPSLAALEA